ncbi:nose resistant to fluoxetine protein 6-like [Planococcus citri]|uniref:nose resistant to fluoxetine protein 6-like n=1 Tax=Planococcus citri TaxID=170843 RepID=UPI0031F9BD5B
MGNYDECLSISSYGIDGQYCLVEAMYNYSDALHSEVVEMPDEKISSWEVVTLYGKNPIRINRKKLRFAVCIPSSCTPTDLKISLDNTLHPIFNAHELNITINVDPVLCKIRDKPARPLGYYIVRNLFGAIFFLVICSTLYDVVTFTGVEMKTEGGPKKHLIKDISKSLSIKENFRKLTKHNFPCEQTGIHFVKVLSMIQIIIGHHITLAIFPFPLSDAFLAEQQFSKLTPLLSRLEILNVFFLISGFLTFHLDFSQMLKGGIIFLLTRISNRWMRMIPTFTFIVLYAIYVFPYIGDGPLWNYRTMTEANNCKESWLPIVFLISNFVNPEKSVSR